MKQNTILNYCIFMKLDKRGYVKIRRFNKEENKLWWQSYHRFIIEKTLGQKLSSSIEVHHRNFNKLDNRLSNLLLVPRQEHKQQIHGEGIKLLDLLTH